MMKRKASMIVEPWITYERPHEKWVNALVVLEDGSFVSCSGDNTAKRWLLVNHNDETRLQLVGVYEGHTSEVRCALERDDHVSIVTGAFDRTLRVWNTATSECVQIQKLPSGVCTLLKTSRGKNVGSSTTTSSFIVCGLCHGMIELRRMDDLSLISTLDFHYPEPVYQIRELADGCFVSSARDNTLKSWDAVKGTLLQTFLGHSAPIRRLIVLSYDRVVSASDDNTIRIWKASTGECLYISPCTYKSCLAKLNDKTFMSDIDNKLVFLDERGEHLLSYKPTAVSALARLKDGSIVIGNDHRFELLRWYHNIISASSLPLTACL